ncbi:hypothetical protein V6N11_075750 [Hibiscus sabdariffa]|uniref:Uncharacterized protein n=1 Tax=Hibiscus sabdariffa TaxID=183260 RepID=A0ABR2Q4R0_9ROSI
MGHGELCCRGRAFWQDITPLLATGFASLAEKINATATIAESDDFESEFLMDPDIVETNSSTSIVADDGDLEFLMDPHIAVESSKVVGL